MQYPNTQPIYPCKPLFWTSNLTTQVPGYTPQAVSGLTPPVLLGTASPSGAMIHSVSAFSLYTPPGGVVDPALGANGLGPAGGAIELIFYMRKLGEELTTINAFNLLADNRLHSSRWGIYPIMPDPQAALILPGEAELYVGLGKPVPAPGLNVFVHGGHYDTGGNG